MIYRYTAQDDKKVAIERLDEWGEFTNSHSRSDSKEGGTERGRGGDKENTWKTCDGEGSEETENITKRKIGARGETGDGRERQ